MLRVTGQGLLHVVTRRQKEGRLAKEPGSGRRRVRLLEPAAATAAAQTSKTADRWGNAEHVGLFRRARPRQRAMDGKGEAAQAGALRQVTAHQAMPAAAVCSFPPGTP